MTLDEQAKKAIDTLREKIEKATRQP